MLLRAALLDQEVAHRRRWFTLLQRFANVVNRWAPSTAFFIPDRIQPVIGVKRVGYLRYMLDATGVTIEAVEPATMVNHDLGDFVEM